jgi:hypothetical protein
MKISFLRVAGDPIIHNIFQWGVNHGNCKKESSTQKSGKEKTSKKR